MLWLLGQSHLQARHSPHARWRARQVGGLLLCNATVTLQPATSLVMQQACTRLTLPQMLHGPLRHAAYHDFYSGYQEEQRAASIFQLCSSTCSLPSHPLLAGPPVKATSNRRSCMRRPRVCVAAQELCGHESCCFFCWKCIHGFASATGLTLVAVHAGSSCLQIQQYQRYSQGCLQIRKLILGCSQPLQCSCSSHRIHLRHSQGCQAASLSS